MAPLSAFAQAEASALSAVSALPVASVVVAGSSVAGAVLAVPVVLSTAGVVLVVQAVQSTARGTVYVLTRMSDGAAVSIELAGRGLAIGALGVGASVTVVAVTGGLVLSSAGEALALIPNALGRALLHNERLTN